MADLAVGEYKGTKIHYNSETQWFSAKIQVGKTENLVKGRSQREVERQIAKLLTKELKIPAMEVTHVEVEFIEIVGKKDRNVEFIDSNGKINHRRWYYSDFYHRDEAAAEELTKLIDEKDAFEESWEKRWKKVHSKLKVVRFED